MKGLILTRHTRRAAAIICLAVLSACVTPEGKKPMSASQTAQIDNVARLSEANCINLWDSKPVEKRREMTQLFEQTGQTLPGFCGCIRKRFVESFDAELYDKFVADIAEHSRAMLDRKPWKALVVKITLQCLSGANTRSNV